MVIDAIGLDSLMKKFKKLENVEKYTAPVIRRGAQEIQNEAKDLAPIDTGTLINSINRSVISREGLVAGIVGTNTEYAIHQEFGTVYQPGKAFLRPALRKHKKEIKEDIINILNKRLRKAGK